MAIRDRDPEDLPALASLLDRVGEATGYPPHRPAPSDLLIVTRDELGAFVDEDEEGRLRGHGALHESSAPAVMAVAGDATGLAVGELGAVARLFVDPTAQRRGVGRALLDRAAARAHELGRRPVLDVWEGLGPARALYESAGWELAGSATIRFRSGCTSGCIHEGTSIQSLVYVGPAR